MACSNAIIVRYKMRIKQMQGPNIAGLTETVANGLLNIGQITKVGGMSLGVYGKEELKEFNKIFRVSDGIRTLPTLKAEMMLQHGYGSLVRDYFFEWHERPNEVVCNVSIDILDRSWCPQFIWEFDGCTMIDVNFEDQELASPKLGKLTFELEPVNVSVLKGLDAAMAAATQLRS